MPLSKVQSNSISDGAIVAADLASTLDLSSKTISLPSNSSKIIRMYNAYSGTAVQGAGTTPFDIGLNFNDVVINAGETPVLFLHVTSRLVSGDQHHCGLRLRYTGSSSGIVGETTWGFGIMQGAGWNWLITTVSGVNLKQIRSNPFNSTGTFNFYVQAATAGATLSFGGEAGTGNTAGYGYLNGTIFITKD
jgi:hypothetical protein